MPTFSEVLKNKEFSKLLVGQLFSNVGDAVLRVALLLYVYSFTGSLTVTTLILSAQIVPWIIVGPIAGVFADRISRKLIMVAADLTRTVAILFIPFTENINILIVISLIIGIASASFTAPRSAAIPEITGLRLFVKGISLSQLVFQTVSIVGPLVGAYVFATFGSSTFFISSVGFGSSAIVITMTNIPSAVREDKTITIGLIFSDLREGIQFLMTNNVTRNIIVLFTFIIFASAYASPLLYPYIYNILHHGDAKLENLSQRQYGIIGSITAIGSILGNLTFGKYENYIGRKLAIFVGSLFLGIFCISFLLQPGLELLGLLSFIFGLSNGTMNLAVNAVFAEAVPNEVRGRAYSATNAYLQTFTAIFTALSGITADLLGIVQTIALVGMVVLVLVCIFSLRTRYQFLYSELAVEN